MKLMTLKVENLAPADFWDKHIRGPVSIVTMQAEMSFLGKKGQEIGRGIENADVIVADGIGFLWGMHLLGQKNLKKCPGIDLVDCLVRKHPNTPTFLWGASDENVAKAAEYYRKKGLNVVGYHNGYDGKDATGEIKASGAKMVLVGNDYAKQVMYVNQIKKELGISAMTVGGSFDVASGMRKRAPKLIQKMHLEGPWRIIVDPKRILRLPRIFGFFWEVAKERIAG